MNENDGDTQQRERPAHRLRIPGFIRDEDLGLGDAVTRMTYAVGVRPCGGCAQRAATLNRWLVLSGRRGK
jgi:hypothetical protein